MRLWHKNFIPILPRQQLLGQWRECCCIVRSITENGTPNHVLVNRIMEYPMSHFYTYGLIVAHEMKKRGYRCETENFTHYFTYPHETKQWNTSEIFRNWHNKRYLFQCYYNLQEKYDCGGITEDEWAAIQEQIMKGDNA